MEVQYQPTRDSLSRAYVGYWNELLLGDFTSYGSLKVKAKLANGYAFEVSFRETKPEKNAKRIATPGVK